MINMFENNFGKNLNDKLISAIHQNIPSNENIVNYISKTLGIGKDSVYRRLRGDIYFTFKDVVTIALSLNISIDEIINIKDSDKMLLELTLSDKGDTMSMYRKKIEAHADTLSKLINSSSQVRGYITLNSIFPFTILKYSNLSRFYLYKCLYQMEEMPFSFTFSMFSMPAEIIEQQDRCVRLLKNIPQYTAIFDRNLYQSTIRDIDYFYKRKLISRDEVLLMKNELLNSITAMEVFATNGITEYGAQVEFYLSSIDIDSSYIYYETDNNVSVQFPVFSTHALESKNKELGAVQKGWIESFRKYSTCISKSSEMERFEYFEQQRQIVDHLDSLF